jgi:hypothetical protein
MSCATTGLTFDVALPRAEVDPMASSRSVLPVLRFFALLAMMPSASR